MATNLVEEDIQGCRFISGKQQSMGHSPHDCSNEEITDTEKNSSVLLCTEQRELKCFLVRVTSAVVKQSTPNNALDTKMKEEKGWIPIIKSGKLVKNGRIKALEEIRKYFFPIAEREVIELFIKSTLETDGVQMTPV
ncbi:hypothetical protein NPIL_603171 [Nephila pilipes]|uniref:Uncharacterized protein n=1 Tax=Nephila pilipes TaxID=299642 RepID=A0A8X6NLP7_NEPPI|nr:hypothetical protein NPIL_603171 [Nephila pilipes]